MGRSGPAACSDMLPRCGREAASAQSATRDRPGPDRLRTPSACYPELAFLLHRLFGHFEVSYVGPVGSLAAPADHLVDGLRVAFECCFDPPIRHVSHEARQAEGSGLAGAFGSVEDALDPAADVDVDPLQVAGHSSREMSRAGAEWVRRPTEINNGPAPAMSAMLSRVTPPEIS